ASSCARGITRSGRSYSRWKPSRPPLTSSPAAKSVSSISFAGFQFHIPPPARLVRPELEEAAFAQQRRLRLRRVRADARAQRDPVRTVDGRDRVELYA